MRTPSRGLFRGPVLAGSVAMLSVLLAGCGTGQVAQTSDKQPSVGGINADIGTIAVRNAHVASPAEATWEPGQTAPLSLYIRNVGATADRLISVSSPVARTAVLMPEGAPLPGAESEAGSAAESAVAAQPTTAGVPSTGTAAPVTPVAPATPTPSAPRSTPTSWQPLALPADTEMMLAPGDDTADQTAGPPTGDIEVGSAVRPGYVALVGIAETLRAGDKISVTLRFETAGEITMDIPVSVPATPRPRASSEAEHEGH